MKSLLKRLQFVGPVSGQTMVIFALALPVIIGVMGLGVDAAHLFNARRDVQAAADLAALAGASQLPGDLGAASSVATDIAAENGFSGSGVTVTAPYGGNENQIEVEISEEYDLFFMPALGISSVTVSARSVASHEINAGTAIMAKKDYHCWEGTYTLGASNVTIDGSVHSNGAVTISGNNNTVNGTVTYKTGPPVYPHDGWSDCGPDNRITGSNPGIEVESGPWRDWPVDFSRSDFPCTWDIGVTGGDIHDDGDWWVGGSMEANHELRPGVYCLSGSGYLDLLNADDVEGNVTLVGQHIRVSGDNMNLSAYSNDVLFYADSTDFPAMTLEPTGGHWEGLIYNRCYSSCGASWLEGGEIRLTAYGGFQHTGSIFGWAVRLYGSGYSIFGTEQATYEPMRLVE